MGLKDLLELLEKLEGRANSYWNFYSVAVFAVAGWLVTKDKGLTKDAAFIIAIGMLVFFVANLSVILFAEGRIAAVEDEVRFVANKEGSNVSPSFSDHLNKKLSIPNRHIFTLILHCLIDFVLLVLIFAKRA